MTQFSRHLRGTTALAALVLTSAVSASPAFAQAATPDTTPGQTLAPAAPPSTTNPAGTNNVNTGSPSDEIVVTGSILRTTISEQPSPVTVVSAEALNQRGINTVQEGIQQLTSNNGAALTNSFTANGAFAAGASAVSLRGLSTSSTLVLFDGLRAAYYPLADDGTRNFVDLNTIPDEIVDRIEVLRDGASSSYGADAIAGVVNIITKKQFSGVGGRAEAGISERGDAPNYRLSLIGGLGDLDSDGYNAYASGFYFRSEALFNRDRPYPFNTDDRRGISYDDPDITGGAVVGPNNVVNGLDATGAFPTFSVGGSSFYVRPYDPTNTTAQGRYSLLNPALGCPVGTSYNLSAGELARPANVTAGAPNTVCQEDFTQNYGVISPKIERFGGSARFTARIGDDAEAYFMANFQQTTSSYTGDPGVIRGNAPTGILFPQYSTSQGGGAFAPGSAVLTLPVYVCAAGANCATAADRRLNPNNPYAAEGFVARLVGRSPEVTYNETRSRVYRAAAGINGTVFNDWDYRVEATAMHSDLRRLQDGYVYIANLLSAIGTGSYNFVNPGLNTPAQNDFLTPVNITNAESDLYQAQVTLGKALFDLPGGPLQLGLGASIRYESVNAPSTNPDTFGPTQRYFTLNAFGTNGSRRVYSAFAELKAPVFDQLLLDASGRYDKYSSGQDYFSPKFGAKFTPVKEIAVRGTYSKGFRIPSFAEANALPTTGYVTNGVSLFNNAYLAQYGCTTATFSACPTYIRSGSYGQTTLASPGLDPEKSRSFTGGVIFQPIRQVSFTADYYNIRKTGAITSLSSSPALQAYYTNGTIPAGYTVIPDAVDPAFPNAKPRVAFVQSALVNSDTIKSEGIDFGANANFKVGQFGLNTSATATWITELSTTFPDGTKERYEGTLGNFNLTAGSGTPEWRFNVQQTVSFEPVQLTAVVNYFDGYDLSADDQGAPRGECGLNPGYVPCRVSSYTTLDLTGSIKVNDRMTFYVNVLNLLDDLPPVDPVTYGANLYNPVQGGTGIYGRNFRAGFRIGL